MKALFSENKITKTAIVFIAIILVLLLFVLRVGVEDNGSLAYTLENIGIYDVNSASGSGYYSPIFGIDNAEFNIFSGNIIYSLVKCIFSLFSIGVIPVYVVSVIYLAFFILGIYLLMKKIKVSYNWNNLLTFIVFAIIVCDIAYISYFNTPYTYAPIISFMPMFIYSIILLSEKKTYLSLILETSLALLIFNTHIVMSVTGIIFSLYSFRFVFFNKKVIWKIISIILSVIVLISCFVFVGNYHNKKDLYNSCFYGALLNRTNAAVIDLPQEYSKFIGVPSFESAPQELINSDEFTEFNQMVDYKNIVAYYLKNPGDLYSNVKNAANNSSVIKIGYLGNFAVGSSAYSKQTTNIWGIYNMLKKAVFPANIFMLIILVIIAVSLSFNYRKNFAESFASKICCELMALCSICALISLFTTVIIFGLTEISFNLLVYNILTDMCVAFAIIGGSRMMFIKRKILTAKYGVNQ